MAWLLRPGDRGAAEAISGPTSGKGDQEVCYAHRCLCVPCILIVSTNLIEEVDNNGAIPDAVSQTEEEAGEDQKDDVVIHVPEWWESKIFR